MTVISLCQKKSYTFRTPKPLVISRLCSRAFVRAVIEQDAKPVAMIIPAEPRPGRLLSEAIAMAEARGSTVTVDKDFARDLEDIINSRS